MDLFSINHIDVFYKFCLLPRYNYIILHFVADLSYPNPFGRYITTIMVFHNVQKNCWIKISFKSKLCADDSLEKSHLDTHTLQNL